LQKKVKLNTLNFLTEIELLNILLMFPWETNPVYFNENLFFR